jgi:transposase-like protein
MPKRYPPEFRRAVCGRLVVGEKVTALSKELGVLEATLYLWKRQALIDAGRANLVSDHDSNLTSIVERHLKPGLGDILVGNLTTAIVDEYSADLDDIPTLGERVHPGVS